MVVVPYFSSSCTSAAGNTVVPRFNKSPITNRPSSSSCIHPYYHLHPKTSKRAGATNRAPGGQTTSPYSPVACHSPTTPLVPAAGPSSSQTSVMGIRSRYTSALPRHCSLFLGWVGRRHSTRSCRIRGRSNRYLVEVGSLGLRVGTCVYCIRFLSGIVLVDVECLHTDRSQIVVATLLCRVLW